MIQALVAAGVRVYALAPNYDDDLRDAVRGLGAEPVDFVLDRTGIRPVRDVLDSWALFLLLRRLAPDATFTNFIKPVIYGSLAAAAAGVRHRFALVAGLGYVFTPDGERVPPGRRMLKALVSALYALGFSACHKVFFQNADDVTEVTKAGLISRDKVVLLSGSGVDLDRLTPQPAVETPPTFLLMARLLKEKGIVEFVQAARVLRRDHPQARFLLLGGVDTNPGGLAEADVVAWRSEGVIEWLGHVADVRPWIAAASVFVLPSYREGKPRSTQEAMAMARPVVTTDAPGCRDTVEEGVNGFMVPVRDPEALAEAMRRFIEQPELIGRMGAESRRLAEERFNVHQINSVILKTLADASSFPKG